MILILFKNLIIYSVKIKSAQFLGQKLVLFAHVSNISCNADQSQGSDSCWWLNMPARVWALLT